MPTSETIAAFTRRLVELVATLGPGERRLVAVAGPPGSGKSTLVESVRAAFAGRPAGAEAVAILPMDGFHYDDELLERLGRKERKGAPDTFDVGGLGATLARLSANEEPAIAVPRFDRDIEIARAGALLIARETPLVLVEGNYLLIDAPPWGDLRKAYDLTAMLMVDEDVLRERLEARWRHYGLSPADIRRKVEDNDLPNGRFVYEASGPADISVLADGG